jgi:hypothetical protein
MNINLWVFLTATVVFSLAFLTIVVLTTHKKKIKELEVEALKLEKANLEAVVEDAVNKVIGDQLSRIEVLEAIVTDKNYDLNEKITRLK